MPNRGRRFRDVSPVMHGLFTAAPFITV